MIGWGLSKRVPPDKQASPQVEVKRRRVGRSRTASSGVKEPALLFGGNGEYPIALPPSTGGWPIEPPQCPNPWKREPERVDRQGRGTDSGGEKRDCPSPGECDTLEPQGDDDAFERARLRRDPGECKALKPRAVPALDKAERARLRRDPGECNALKPRAVPPPAPTTLRTIRNRSRNLKSERERGPYGRISWDGNCRDDRKPSSLTRTSMRSCSG